MVTRPDMAVRLTGTALLLAALLTPARSSAAGDGGATGDALAPATILRGPSLLETGKISPAKLEGDPPTKETRAAPKLPARPEPKVAGPDTPDVAPAAPPKMAVPPVVQHQITARLRELRGCRVRVAHDKHLAPAQLRAGAVLLRWTIGGDGTVSGTEVVEQTPVDPALLECAQQTISKWTFPVPDKGPIPVERRYRFQADQ